MEHINFVLGMAKPAQKGFQAAYSPVMEGIIDLHHYICFFLVLILVFVSWTLGYTLFRYSLTAAKASYYNKVHIKNTNTVSTFGYKFIAPLLKALFNINEPVSLKETKKFSHWTGLEIAWTTLPSLVLLSIAVPSFILLYSTDELTDDVAITIKVIGHQWYWSYEYVDLTADLFTAGSEQVLWAFDSYMVPWEVSPESVLNTEHKSYNITKIQSNRPSMRLLCVDNPLYLPIKTHIRVIVSSTDVLHSFAMPSMGIKIDAVPGRLNQGFMYITASGTFFGQCSEICGVNHGFMPIQIVAVPWETWTEITAQKFAQR